MKAFIGESLASVAFIFCFGSHFALAGPLATAAVKEAIELAAVRSGTVLADGAAKDAATAALEQAFATHGERALIAARQGGLELVEASNRFGPDVMDYAVRVSPTATRMLALDTERLLPLARRYGPDALELEAKSPGLSERAFQLFGPEGAKFITRDVAREDIPRLLAYGERTAPASRQLLLDAYKKEGESIFGRVGAKDLSSALSSAVALAGMAGLMSILLPYAIPILIALCILGAIGLFGKWLDDRRELARGYAPSESESQRIWRTHFDSKRLRK